MKWLEHRTYKPFSGIDTHWGFMIVLLNFPVISVLFSFLCFSQLDTF